MPRPPKSSYCAAKPRYHINVHLGHRTHGSPPLQFLYDTGASPSCIDHSTFLQAQRLGAVRPLPEAQLDVTSADGSSMATHQAQLLTLSLDDGFTFEAPVQVAPDLSKPGLLGQNVLDPLGITVCPVRKQLVRSCTTPVVGTPVSGSIMSCSPDTSRAPPAPHTADFILGPVCDSQEEPLASPDQLFTFYPTRTVHIPPMSARKVSLQAYDPSGSPFRRRQEFVAAIAPAGSAIAHQTSSAGVMSIYLDNPTLFPQQIPSHMACAIGATLDDYYAFRGVSPAPEPQPWLPSEIAAFHASRPPDNSPVDPAIMDQIQAHVNKAPASYRDRLLRLLTRHHKIFSTGKFDLGLVPRATHTIELHDATPAFTKQFTIPEAHRDFLINNLRDWVKAGIVKKTVSKFNSPIFVVPKKDGSLRVVLDYRKLNSQTMPDRYTIRTLEACLADVGRMNSKVFSTLDLTSAFWQMALLEGHQRYTAFTLPGFGQYCWTRGAMGLTGCPASFARIMDKIMEGLDFVITYIDDVLIHSPSADAHLDQLDQALARLTANNLKVNLAKCEIMLNQVSYLGFTISHRGVSPGLAKTDIIRNTPCPTSPKQLQSFIGICNFFRSFIKNFAMKAGPLYDLIRQDSTWSSGPMPPRAIKAFLSLRDEIAAIPRLGLPTASGDFHLYVDAALGDQFSAGGLGAVLFQRQGPHQQYVPLGFASRRLQNAESRYPIHNLELQAAVFGIESFDHLLRGRRFHIFTDHKPLETQSKLQAKTLNRLQELLGRHQCTVNYIKGKSNIVADFLSRFTQPQASQGPQPAFATAMEDAMRVAQPVASLTAMCSREEIIKEQQSCPQASKIILLVTNQSDGMPTPRTMEYFMVDGVLCARKRSQPTGQALVFAPTGLRRRYMALAHKSVGHGGEKKVLDRMARFVYWPDMTADLRMFLPTCGPCSIKKRDPHLQPQVPQSSLPQEEHPNARVHVDLHGPLLASDKSSSSKVKKYIMVCTCAFSKIVKLIILPNKEEKTVADAFLNQWCYTFGFPKSIVTDQGKEFTNKLLKSLLDSAQVRHHTTAPYHPQANGQAEVFNRTMDQYLRATLTEDRLASHQWEGLIAHLGFVYNTAVHRAIKRSPFNVLFGYDPRVPGFEEDSDKLLAHLRSTSFQPHEDRWQEAQSTNEATRAATLKAANIGKSFPLFKVGDRVQVLRDHFSEKEANPKLQPLWINATVEYLGRSEHNYFVRMGSSKKITLVHASKLRLQTTADESAQDPSYKPPSTHRAVDTSRRITRALAKLQQGQVASLKGYTPPPPGCSWSKLDLINMFQAYAAHKLTPPEMTFNVYPGPVQVPQAVLPVPHNAQVPVQAEPVPDTGPQDRQQDTDHQEQAQQARHQARTSSGSSSSSHDSFTDFSFMFDQDRDDTMTTLPPVSPRQPPDFVTPTPAPPRPPSALEAAEQRYYAALKAAKDAAAKYSEPSPIPRNRAIVFGHLRDFYHELDLARNSIIRETQAVHPHQDADRITRYFTDEAGHFLRRLDELGRDFAYRAPAAAPRARPSPSPRLAKPSVTPEPDQAAMARQRRQHIARARQQDASGQGPSPDDLADLLDKALPSKQRLSFDTSSSSAFLSPDSRNILEEAMNLPTPSVVAGDSPLPSFLQTPAPSRAGGAQGQAQPTDPAEPARLFSSWRETPEGISYLELKANKPPKFKEHLHIVSKPNVSPAELAELARNLLQLPLANQKEAQDMYAQTILNTQHSATRISTSVASFKSLIKHIVKSHNDFLMGRWNSDCSTLRTKAEMRFTSQ